MELEALTAAVSRFLYYCQPYFNQLEAAARSLLFQITPLPLDVYIRVKVFKGLVHTINSDMFSHQCGKVL